jgi:PPK2 family polyphosphate:nucleotide phosphotransferase
MRPEAGDLFQRAASGGGEAVTLSETSRAALRSWVRTDRAALVFFAATDPPAAHNGNPTPARSAFIIAPRIISILESPVSQALTVEPGAKIRWGDFDPAYHGHFTHKQQAEPETRQNIVALADLSYRLYGQCKQALLIVLQGLDTAGKDGVVRHVMNGVSPQSCVVSTFKRPSEEELSHDFLWRVHRVCPPRGYIGIFNRSHYEDVLVARVHKLVEKRVWKARYAQINAFEKLLVDSGTRLLKLFLYISKDEQRQRLQKRLDNPAKRWKLDPQDFEDRRFWDKYRKAYEEALTRTNTDHAPWHIIPADHKWYRDFVVSRLVREALEAMHPEFPPPHKGLEHAVLE